ncbi:Integration host factor subunit alpha [Dissostichus eleginoides]|uniref:Integration host factor subunit alpha n=1 Tax=Dissostichus eleginoides TaxID=100907 RepID=A0AAD9BNG2_DISEL|nr:Integration host factor subunit alpha [Dissostichus eleginoides]
MPQSIFGPLKVSRNTPLEMTRGTSSHTKYRAASDEEEREEVLVQSAMQMATENMSTSQSGTRTASFCQFIHNKSNATP